MTRAQPVFAVEKLRVEREAVILHDLSWRVERGQHWVILGANGSGKTSLLNALTGYLVPSGGEVRIGSARFGAVDWRQVRSSVGLVSASLGHAIEPAQTAREVVLSGLEAQINFWRKPSVAELRRASRILGQVRGSHLAQRAWRHLSQGERQRILIGRALMARLKILFLDEPCAGLDPVAREDFLGLLTKLMRSPRAPALVLVTHHVEEIIPDFTHLLLLRVGRVLAAGPLKKTLSSKLLGETFNANARLRRAGRRYQLRISSAHDTFQL